MSVVGRENFTGNIFEGVTIGYIVLLFISPILVIFYGWYRCKNIKDHKDILEFSLIGDSNKIGVDGWLLSHYIWFLVIGYIYPKMMRLSLLLGVLWEVFEWYVGEYKPKFLLNLGFCSSPSGAKKRNNVWWYWKWQDLIVNPLGFISGKYLRTGRII
jgi:hypothetical protein